MWKMGIVIVFTKARPVLSWCQAQGKGSSWVTAGRQGTKVRAHVLTCNSPPTSHDGYLGMRCAYAHTLTFGLYSLLQRDHVIYGKAKYSSLHANGEDTTYASSCVPHISLKTHRFKIQNSKSLHLHMFNELFIKYSCTKRHFPNLFLSELMCF